MTYLTRWGLPLAALLIACDGTQSASSDAGADAMSSDGGLRPGAPAAPTCPRPNEAPIRQLDGAHRCTRVGATPPSAPCAWPAAMGAATPVAYVGRDRAPDGTTPLADLAAALAVTPRPATILLGCGTFPLAATVSLEASVTIRGAGPGASILMGPPRTTALRVGADGGPELAVTLADLEIRYGTDDAGASSAPAVLAQGGGTRVTLRNVAIAHPGEGLRAALGATVCASGVTVEAAGQSGVTLLDGADAFLQNVLVRGNALAGIVVDRAHVDIDTALLADNGRDGLILLGSRADPGTCASDGSCRRAPACADLRSAAPTPVQRCVQSPPPRDGVSVTSVRTERRCRSVTHLVDVTVLRNHGTGINVGRTQPTMAEITAGRRNAVLAEPGPIVLASRLVIAGTGVVPGLGGGYGLYAGPSSDVTLDPDVPRDAGPERESEFLGRRSEIVRNAAGGVIVDGDRITSGSGAIVADLLQPGRCDVAGALVASNDGPGVFAQYLAEVSHLAFTRVTDNAAVGIGAGRSGRVVAIFCDQSVFTRTAVFASEGGSGRPVVVGDGLSFADGSTGRSTTIANSEFSDNARFGTVFSGSDADFQGTNRGVGNQFGVGIYGRALVTGNVDRIVGRSPAPASADVLRSPAGP